MLRVDMVGDQAAACPYACADDGALAAPEQSTYDRAPRRRTPHNLCLGVVPRIVVVLLAFGLVVGLLPKYVKWK